MNDNKEMEKEACNMAYLQWKIAVLQQKLKEATERYNKARGEWSIDG